MAHCKTLWSELCEHVSCFPLLSTADCSTPKSGWAPLGLLLVYLLEIIVQLIGLQV